MKQRLRLFLIALAAIGLLTGCGKEKEEDTSDEVGTTEQVAFDDVQVEDYSLLSYSELEVLAYEDDTKAQVMLGRILEYGTDDVKQDFTEAISWYQMASDSGNIDGTCALGYFYLTGTGVDKDLDKAYELFSAAIDEGSINAKVGLARVLLAQGDYEAIAEEALTADASSTEFSGEAQDDTSETNVGTLDTAEAVDIDDTLVQIVDLLSTAQTAGDLDGAYYLGHIYEKGIGVSLDYKRAFDYYNRVSNSSSTALYDRDAINLSNIAIGLMYVKGLGVEEDANKALDYFTTASENGSAKANYYIGQMYENGIGVDRDYEQAMEYYLIAADYDYAPALNQIGYLYYNGYGVDVDFASAVYYQKLAALQGYTIAQVNLGFLYENGYGVERNLETALSYYEMAADSGYEGAMEAVVRVKAQINEEM